MVCYNHSVKTFALKYLDIVIYPNLGIYLTLGCMTVHIEFYISHIINTSHLYIYIN